jgi:hypothetical protein
MLKLNINGSNKQKEASMAAPGKTAIANAVKGKKRSYYRHGIESNGAFSEWCLAFVGALKRN